jgi:organic radical activating enzyme
MKDLNYVLHITKKCNWFCRYCIVDTHNSEDIYINDILKHIDNIPNNSVVNLSGGEPGILSSDKLNLIFNKLRIKECEININTNGLFFKNHKNLDKYISNYFYHLSEDLYDIPFINYISDIDLKLLENIRDNIVY